MLQEAKEANLKSIRSRLAASKKSIVAEVEAS